MSSFEEQITEALQGKGLTVDEGVAMTSRPRSDVWQAIHAIARDTERVLVVEGSTYRLGHPRKPFLNFGRIDTSFRYRYQKDVSG